MKEALTYSINQRKNLETFMRDGKIPLSNNWAECHIRPFATHRRAYDLNVYDMKYILTRMPALDHHNHPERLEVLLPWSQTLPKECYRKNSPKKDEKASFDTCE